jgi:DUF4097 and DUF4098 domain-containing protein YvlB
MSNGLPQRRSIFSGLLLILIGVLFILHRHYPALGVGHLFRAYWPLILIAWGLAKLYDNFSSRGFDERRPPIVSGGEVALIVLLVVVVSGMSGFDWVRERNPDMDFTDLWVDRGVPVTETIGPVPVKANSPVVIETTNGDVTVFADEPGGVRVVATKKVSAVSDDASRKRGEQIHIQIDPVNGGCLIHPSGATGGTGHAVVDLEVHLPKQVTVTVKTDKGDINLNGIAGEVSATSQHGDVEVHDIRGNVNATLDSGDVRITNVQGDVHIEGRGNEVSVSKVSGDATLNGDFYGTISISDVAQTTHYTSTRTDLSIGRLNGSVDMDSSSLQISDAAGNIKLATRDRDVDIQNPMGRVEVNGKHGDISVTLKQPPKEEISITNDSGGVELALPSKSTFEISAASKSGDVQSEFDADGLVEQNQGDSGKLEGKVGMRGPKITIATSYGTIDLQKSDG